MRQPAAAAPLLEVRQLCVTLPTRGGPARAVNGLDFTLARGQTLGLIGESGSGKTLAALALLGLLPEGARAQGSVRFGGRELLGLDDAQLCRLRGNRIGMVFQEPMSALNPVHPIGRQVAEPLRLHRGLTRAQARAEAAALLERVGIAQAARRLDAYPHQFSGGQRQRITIAMALACGPDLLIADEPTTALDAVLQRQVLELLAGLSAERGMALILISHDLGAVAQTVQRTLVMYGGAVVESGPTAAVFGAMAHPYTRGLFAARPHLHNDPRTPGGRLPTIPGTVPDLADLPPGCPFAGRCAFTAAECHAALPPAVALGAGHAARCVRLAAVAAAQPAIATDSIASSALPTGATGRFDPEPDAPPLLRVRGLERRYPLPRTRLLAPRAQVPALQGVSFDMAAGRSLGLVGESGSGKSTLARLVMALDAPSGGTVELLGRDLHALPARELRAARRDFQMVFQDPYGSLDPRQTVERIVAEPLQALGGATRAELREQAAAALAQVGLRAGDAHKYPHEFSGGQRQRIAIARALITRPRLIVADEPVSALDVSVQAQVLNLLRDLQERLGIAYLLISHDLAVVRHLCDEALVLHQGRIVERGTPAALFGAPRHPYTRALVAAARPL